MRNALWILLIAGLNVLCAWLVLGSWQPQNQGFVFFIFALFATPNIGTIWMIYTAMRKEAKPLAWALLALVPFSFLWYYFERRRKAERLVANREGLQSQQTG